MECPRCGSEMECRWWVASLPPDPTESYGGMAEALSMCVKLRRERFSCPSCGHVEERDRALP